MTRPGDPRGHYARLGVAAWATQQAIDVAFHARTRELEPGRKPPPDAAQRREALLEAHRTLSDPVLRRAYDDESAVPDDEEVGPAAARPGWPWYRQRPVLFGVVASASIALVAVAIVRTSGTVAPAPARAFTPPAVQSPPRYERRVVTGSGVNLRAGPGTEHPLAGRVARGETVDLLQAETDGWAHIRLGDGRRGYIAARFLAAP